MHVPNKTSLLEAESYGGSGIRRRGPGGAFVAIGINRESCITDDAVGPRRNEEYWSTLPATAAESFSSSVADGVLDITGH